MPLWTISWQAGSGGRRIASALADRANVQLVDAEWVGAFVQRALDAHGHHTRALWRWLASLGTAAGPMFGATWGSVDDGDCPPSRRELCEAAILEASRSPSVVADCFAFALLASRPNACHVRIRAPLTWRVRRYSLEHCISTEAASRELVRLERQHRMHTLRRHHRRLDSASNFTVVCDASQYQPDEIVDMLLVAGEPTASSRAPDSARILTAE